MKWKKILRVLSESDTSVSGELLGGALGITRASIWKYINFLSAEGFIIESERKKGYKLIFPKDTPVFLEPRDFSTKLFAKNIQTFITTISTNEDAVKAAKHVPEGTLFIAEYQHGGKGRRGRSWSSPFGKGIYCSLILKPSLPVFKAPRITMLAGVAVGTALKKFGADIQLKWPNDIMVNGKKIGGILSELFIEGEDVEYVTLGVGLNVNTEKSDFPDEIKNTAGSILTETGNPHSRIAILKEIIKNLEKYYNDFLKNEGELNGVKEEWEAMAYGKDRLVMITTGKEKEKGRIIGLRNDGALLAEINGKVREIYAGELGVT